MCLNALLYETYAIGQTDQHTDSQIVCYRPNGSYEILKKQTANHMLITQKYTTYHSLVTPKKTPIER